MRHRFGSLPLCARALLTALALCAVSLTAQANVRVTADNSYALFYRDASGALTFVGSDDCTTAGCIYASETYADPPPGRDIYVVAWSDHATAQGLRVEVNAYGGPPILSGDPRWRVYATNVNFNGTPGSAAFSNFLNARINGSTPANWVTPTVGATGPWGPVTGFSGGNWMWFQSNKQNCGGSGTPFQPGCNHNEYLIFRLTARDLPQPPCASAGVPSVCCLSRGFKGQNTYAFAVVVNNQTGGPATINVTSTQGVVNIFAPQTIPPGNSLVTGTFSAPANANVCLIIEVAGGGQRCRVERCLKALPTCPKLISEESDDPIDIKVELEPETPRVEPTRPRPRARPRRRRT